MIDNNRAYKAEDMVTDTLTKGLPPKALNNHVTAVDILSSFNVLSW